MKKLLLLIGFMSLFTVLTGCSDDSSYRLSQEEREAEELEKKKEEEEAQKRKAEWEQMEKQKEWEKENTDEICYRVGRYSKNGKTVDSGMYTLSPESGSKLKMHDLENRGFNKELDSKFLVVESSFFQGFPPSSKFDIYCVVWKKGSRSEAIRVDIGHHDISRGW
ncbi:hypothetical protein QUG02_04970 [Bacillus hominis]|uniref:Lipoprotein n=1 Tax=Bacillus hominis TaxID=2817478 RepID=A0ABT7R3I4_9BACI|nr:hypothetical protein [Bacillus hominis]MDM5192330.1 hypothetical protein [Bacillus hominis]MDM5432058.1 hypothetical protein [Bacillus hominis]MDM5437494.1 hypothetical protein [Bacillus hominis]